MRFQKARTINCTATMDREYSFRKPAAPLSVPDFPISDSGSASLAIPPAFSRGGGLMMWNFVPMELLVLMGIMNQSINKFQLFPNYPNPFSPETTIQYELPYAINVSLKIYDILGQEIRTIVDSRQPDGTYSVIWDGRDNKRSLVSSDIYFCRPETGRFIEYHKMILMRQLQVVK
jgi:FlgD Ig-like domain